MTKLYDRAFACTAEEVERDQLLTVRWAAADKACAGACQLPARQCWQGQPPGPAGEVPCYRQQTHLQLLP
jgi:hypothetical protein